MEQKKHILMVDDVSTNLKCEGEVLKGKYKMSMAKSGEQALELLSEIQPDLILLDIYMPGMDGYETMVKIKENADYADIPVIFLSGDSKSEAEKKGMNMGAAGYICKPFAPNVLLEKIESILLEEESVI